METLVHQCKKVKTSDAMGTSCESSRQSILLSSAYLAPVEYYSKLFRAQKVFIETHESYVKQSYRNRCHIVGANGVMQLNIPIEKPRSGQNKIKDIRIANHGNWQHRHWIALISAYNSTPFFEYYREELQPFYEQKQSFLIDFNAELQRLICKWLYIETTQIFTSEYMRDDQTRINDLRNTIHPKLSTAFDSKEYYQVFKDKLGFVPNASIVDLLFNMGNEARLFL